MSSPTPAINAIAREVEVDVASSNYGLEPMSWGHVAGVLNEWADALSRLHAPEAKTVPAQLATFEPETLPLRDGVWWRASRGVKCLERGGRKRQGRRVIQRAKVSEITKGNLAAQ